MKPANFLTRYEEAVAQHARHLPADLTITERRTALQQFARSLIAADREQLSSQKTKVTLTHAQHQLLLQQERAEQERLQALFAARSMLATL